VDLPLIPEQNHGKTKNNPQNGSAYIVHGSYLKKKAFTLLKKGGGLTGTGSKPPAHQGWHRESRCNVK
jgi:hypothetical protein